MTDDLAPLRKPRWARLLIFLAFFLPFISTPILNNLPGESIKEAALRLGPQLPFFETNLAFLSKDSSDITGCALALSLSLNICAAFLFFGALIIAVLFSKRVRDECLMLAIIVRRTGAKRRIFFLPANLALHLVLPLGLLFLWQSSFFFEALHISSGQSAWRSVAVAVQAAVFGANLIFYASVIIGEIQLGISKPKD